MHKYTTPLLIKEASAGIVAAVELRLTAYGHRRSCTEYVPCAPRQNGEDQVASLGQWPAEGYPIWLI